jgi:hypothetical protein
MASKVAFILGVSSLTVASLFVGADAWAGIDACGDIEVEANAHCEVKVGLECKAECTPIHFTAACYADCSGECNVSVDAGCTVDCQADCSASCEVDPGSFECSASCEGECNAGCDGQCSSSSDQATCRGSCEATCHGECSASCEGTPPSASCEAKCEASCDGECHAEANVDCQIDCQAGCTAELTGGCEVECDKPEGSLFCDGQYIDHGGNLEECINALNALLEVSVDVSATGSASCDGGSCEAEGEAGVSCALSQEPATAEHRGPWLALAAAGLGVAVARRRRK